MRGAEGLQDTRTYTYTHIQTHAKSNAVCLSLIAAKPARPPALVGSVIVHATSSAFRMNLAELVHALVARCSLVTFAFLEVRAKLFPFFNVAETDPGVGLNWRSIVCIGGCCCRAGLSLCSSRLPWPNATNRSSMLRAKRGSVINNKPSKTR